MSSLPLVAIVGAPNVGKSTLFNRLVGRRQAIVTGEPGATRDRIYGEVRRGPMAFRVVDTGGLWPLGDAPFAREIEQQAAAALNEAALVLFVVDARSGATATDRDVGQGLRRSGVPVLLVANKIDDPVHEVHTLDLHELGLGDPIPISAQHGLGMETLLDVVSRHLGRPAEPLPGPGTREVEVPPIRLAIVGRPNVGKSSLVNRLLGKERMLVSEIPGTTRDAVDTLIERDHHRYLLVDTAGLRRRGRPRENAEYLSVVQARKSIERADVVVVVLDTSRPFAAQDAHIAGFAMEAFKPMVIAVNKWDLEVQREERAREWEETIRHRLRFAHDVPMVLVSALEGKRVTRLLDHVDELYRAAGTRIPTPELNRWLREVSRAEERSPARGRSVRLLYAVQTGVHPLQFTLFCNDPDRVHFSLQRFLVNSLRGRFQLGPVPVRIRFRGRESGNRP